MGLTSTLEWTGARRASWESFVKVLGTPRRGGGEGGERGRTERLPLQRLGPFSMALSVPFWYSCHSEQVYTCTC